MTLVLPKGKPVGGIRIGIVCLDTRHALAIGNVQHAASFAFPVAYSVVSDIPLEALMRGDPAALPSILAAVRRLEAMKVDLIAGACGSFGHYQRDVAAAIGTPVCLSILCQVPFLLSILPAGAKLAVLFARASAFTPRVQAQCGIEDSSRIVAIGADQLPAFAPILDASQDLDESTLCRELSELVTREQARHPEIGAWLLQCSDLPPYAGAVTAASGKPVFDMTQLIEHFDSAVRRRQPLSLSSPGEWLTWRR